MFNFDEKRMSFIEHLGELRTRLIRIAISIVVTFILGFAISDHLLAAIQWPLNTGIERYNARQEQLAKERADKGEAPGKAAIEKVTWVTLAPQTSFVIYMKLAMYFSLVISFPVFLYQVCAFIFPGLKSTERGLIIAMLGGSFLLALFGVGTSYGGVLPFVMPYLLQYTPHNVVVQLELTETLAFILTIIVGFAIAFQFPMLVLAGVGIGVLNAAMLSQYRRIAIVLIAVISAVLTPPDVISMSVMMLPLILLYELSIIVAKIVEWRRNKKPASTDITPV